MNGWSHHLIIAPILIPVAAAAILLFIDERRRVTKAMVSLVSALLLLLVAFVLFRIEAGPNAFEGVYLLGNWSAPFGIVLVLDGLSALMLLLTAIVAAAALIYSMARWHAMGAHFHSMFQLLLMGVNGAFLTGDLFNLFVFFEVMLAASYGLLLHGSGPLRVKAGLHYIAVNLAAALLFLIGVSLIYGTTGTLNMADLAARIPDIEPDRRMLMEAGAGVLGIAFLIKAGMWPLCFGCRDLRHPEQARHLRHPAADHASVRDRTIRRLRFDRAALWRHRDADLRHDRRAGVAGAWTIGRVFGAGVLRHVADGSRHQ
jgi:multicomponent K+:H+ antiporter subunit D